MFMRYIIHLYLVLGNCTQVHLQCTWVVPKYTSPNPVLVLVLEIFYCTCTCTQVLIRFTCGMASLSPFSVIRPCFIKSFYKTYNINVISNYFNQNRSGAVGRVRWEGAQTHLFSQFIIKSTLTWLKYANGWRITHVSHKIICFYFAIFLR